jgi:hypothetical protein
MSRAGASGIVTENLGLAQQETTIQALKPEPNTNLIAQRSLIPLIEHSFVSLTPETCEIVLVAKVFAVATDATCRNHAETSGLKERWLDRPVLGFEGEEKGSDADLILLDGP